MKKLLLLVTLVAAFAAVLATGASADYGNTATYQIELSANIPGHLGGGVWLWIELSSDYTGDYTGSDCGHAGQGAAADKGSVNWFYSDASGNPDTNGGYLTISGVTLNGLGGFPSTVIVPDTYGHYTGTDTSYLTLPGFIPGGIGNSQLQVAP
jgi:hypothetical protein